MCTCGRDIQNTVLVCLILFAIVIFLGILLVTFASFLFLHPDLNFSYSLSLSHCFIVCEPFVKHRIITGLDKCYIL